MSLITQIQALATRVAAEFNTLRGEKVTYSKVDDTLIGSVTNNTAAWNLAVAGKIVCALATSNAITLSGHQQGKVTLVELTNSGGAAQTFPTSEFWGDEVNTDGLFYITIECWSDATGSEKVLITSRKSKA